MNSVNSWRFATLTSVLVATAVVTLIIQLSLVTGADTDSGTVVKQVKSVGEPDDAFTTSQSYVNLPGAVTTVTVPAGQQALILSRFAGESSCSQSPVVNVFCVVRVTINGVPQDEVVVFDSVRVSEGGRSSHSYETANTFGPGTYSVRVQFRVDEPNAIFSLYQWRLTVERIKK